MKAVVEKLKETEKRLKRRHKLPKESSFEVGSSVTWTSQSGRKASVKIGTIIAVIPAGKVPLKHYYDRKNDPALLELLGEDWQKLYSPKALGLGRYRDHESYLVSVPRKKKSFLYWPVVFLLKNADEVEILAEYAHRAWSGWMRYLFSKCDDENFVACIPSHLAYRWKRQMNTPFADLPESEKESDRKEAREILALLK